MKDGITSPILLVLLLASAPVVGLAQPSSPLALVIHGGAGTIRQSDLSPDMEARYREKLTEALKTGYAILSQGGSSLDAVEATIRLLEDSELFNAGKGAVFTAEGKNELDASIMDGSTLQAGAVAGVTTIKNPISAARAVMEQTDHVLLSGAGADVFGESIGLEIVDPEYFFTQRRWDSLQRHKSSEQKTAPDARSIGTVGALALDREGRLAAATSTGGTTNKRWGRIGDSPLIGAGTFANKDCAVSATGTGEYFIRNAVAHDICARAEYSNLSVSQAAETVIFEVLEPDIGGVITLDSQGKPSMPFNTEGMYRGYILSNGESVVEIYKQ